MQSIYESICAQGRLTEAHRKELKEKRGFTDETIAKFRFFSGGEYLLKTEEPLNKSFTPDALLASGVMINTGKSPTLNPQLLEEKIIIPYITDGAITLLRPHKFGLKNTGIQIYVAAWG